MIRFSWFSVWTAVLLALSGLTASRADEPRPAPAGEEIARWITNLDSDKYDERQTASAKLTAIGQPAIPALVKAAAGDSPEVTRRSIAILKELFQSKEEATQKAARDALEKLANGSHSVAAQQAREVLPKSNPGGAFPPPFGGGFGGIQVGGVIAAGGSRVSMKMANGVKEIDAEGEGKKVKITDDPNAGIKMAITAKDDKGKETTRKVEAKNAEELQKKDKEAHELYKKYSANMANGMFQIRFAGGGAVAGWGGGVAVPLAQVDVAQRLMKNWQQQLARMTGEKELKGAPKESLDGLRKEVEGMKKQLGELEKRLQQAGKAAPAPAGESK